MFELGGKNDSDDVQCESFDKFFQRSDYCFSFNEDLNHLSNNTQSDDTFDGIVSSNDSGLHSPLEFKRSLSLASSSFHKKNGSTTSKLY